MAIDYPEHEDTGTWEHAVATARHKAKKIALRGRLLIVKSEKDVPFSPSIGLIFAVSGEPTIGWPRHLKLPEFSGRDCSQVVKFIEDL